MTIFFVWFWDDLKLLSQVYFTMYLKQIFVYKPYLKNVGAILNTKEALSLVADPE